MRCLRFLQDVEFCAIRLLNNVLRLLSYFHELDEAVVFIEFCASGLLSDCSEYASFETSGLVILA